MLEVFLKITVTVTCKSKTEVRPVTVFIPVKIATRRAEGNARILVNISIGCDMELETWQLETLATGGSKHCLIGSLRLGSTSEN